MGFSKIILGASSCVFGLAFAVPVFAGVVGVPAEAIKTEADCTAQEGFVVDAAAGKTCWAPLIPVEFQTIAYAADLKGVDSCAKADIANTNKAGKYCKILLSATSESTMPAMPIEGTTTEPVTEPVTETVTEPAPATGTPPIAEKIVDAAKEEAEKVAEKKAREKTKKSLLKIFGK